MNHCRAGCFSITLLSLVAVASAGPVSLSDNQRHKLGDLVKSDPEARQQFEEIRNQADAALKIEPDPIESIRSEGKLQKDPEKIRTTQSLRDMPRIGALAFAYAVTGDAAYADKTRQFLLAWAKVNKSRGDPIDDTNLESPIVAYDLVRVACSDSERATIDNWLRKTAEAEMGSAKKGAATSMNNWHSHRLKVMGLIGLLLEDRKLIDYTVAAFKQQIDRNLKPDGSSWDFHERDALHYHVYDLEPLLTLAIAYQQAGIDLYGHTSPEGASLYKSVQFLVPYCDGSKTHAEFVGSKVAFDRKRAEAGDAHYKAGALFEPTSGRKALELAAFFDPSLNKLAVALSGTKAEHYSSWRMVLNQVQRG